MWWRRGIRERGLSLRGILLGRRSTRYSARNSSARHSLDQGHPVQLIRDISLVRGWRKAGTAWSPGHRRRALRLSGRAEKTGAPRGHRHDFTLASTPPA